MAQTRKLRVLTLIDRPVESGGGEQLARTIAMRLDPTRFERHLCATRPVPITSLEPIVEAGVRAFCLERSSKAALAAWRPLISVLRDERIDILHAHKFGSNVWGTMIGRLVGVPVVIAHEHTWSYQGHPLRRLLDRELIGRAADVILAVSREDRQKMIEIEHIDPNRIRFVPNGISAKPPTHGDAIRSELGIPPGAPVIGSVGSLRPQKALHFLIECAALLVRDFTDLRVLIAGEGREDARIRSLIRTHHLEQIVVLLGHRSDIPEVLGALDVAVSTSDWEGSPLAVMEYMAAGKPIVATRVGGVPDLIKHGVHGFLVEPADVEGLARSIAVLLRDPEQRVAMGGKGRQRQQLEFDIDLLVGRLEMLYEELFRVTARARGERLGAEAQA
jgi:glycosyltransferase involved in cell wall biosynthesis